MQLRVALVWDGELMADHVAGEGAAAITVGSGAGCTFVVPALGLPDGFAVLRRDGARWQLALPDGGDGSVRLTPLAATDCGVIELGGAGLQLFYQFVEPEAPLPRRRSSWELLTPALAFALLLHSVLLFATYVFDDERTPLVYGGRQLTGEYLVQRIVAPPEPPTGQDDASQPASAAPSRGAGTPGRGEPEAGEIVDPRLPTRAAPPSTAPPPDAGLLRRPNRAVIERVIDHDLAPSLGRFLGLPGRRGPGTRPGSGPGPGTRPGPGNGPGDGPGVGQHGPDGPARPLDIGPLRDRQRSGPGEPREVEVELLPPTTDNPSLTRDEIRRIVESRAGLIRACYQRGVDRSPGLAGTVVVRFVIAPDGQVRDGRITDASTLGDAGVDACVLRQIVKLRFPARGGGTVTFPFRFDTP